MRVYSKSGSASWSVFSPGEVAERHRKKVSSRARVREHTARIPVDTLEIHTPESPKHITHIANLSLRAFGPPVESSWEGCVWRFCLTETPRLLLAAPR